jgi:hypothetical protein
VRGGDLFLESLLHRFVGPDVPALARYQPRDRRLVILVGLDPQVTTVMAVRHQRIVELSDRKRHAQVLGVAVSDVRDQPLKQSV